MSKGIKPRIDPPRITDALPTVTELSAEMLHLLAEGEDAEEARFEGVHFTLDGVEKASFRGCVFRKCSFPQAGGLRYDFMDCAFEGCDLAGARFPDSSFVRCGFSLCRAIGASFADIPLRQVRFDECQMGYSNFGQARLSHVLLQGCELAHASFGEAKLTQVSFEDCVLSGAEFFHTSLKGMDLRSNQIDGIVLGDRSEIAGAKVTPLQACELALLLGVIIEEEVHT